MKKIHKSKTMWLSVLTAVAGATLAAVPEALPAAAAGPGLIVLAAAQAALRVLTTQPVR